MKLLLILGLLVSCSSQSTKQNMFLEGCFYGVKSAQKRNNYYFPLSHEVDTKVLLEECGEVSRKVE